MANQMRALWVRSREIRRDEFLFFGEFQAREGHKFAGILVVHDPLPSVGCLVVSEGGVKVAIFAFEEEGDFIAVALSMADGVAGEAAAASGVEPEASVLARRCVPTDEDDRFVKGLALCILLVRSFVDADVFVAQHPVGLDIVRRVGVPGNRALKEPVASHVIE